MEGSFGVGEKRDETERAIPAPSHRPKARTDEGARGCINLEFLMK
jgi:hypothetical protein